MKDIPKVDILENMYTKLKIRIKLRPPEVCTIKIQYRIMNKQAVLAYRMGKASNSTVNPSGREFIVDSGTSMHTVSKMELPTEE